MPVACNSLLGMAGSNHCPPDRLIQEVLTLCGQVDPVVTEEPSPAFRKRELCIMFPDCDVGCFLAVLCQLCVDCLRPTRVPIFCRGEIDPFHLDFCACAMDWRVKSAGSRGEHVSWVAGRAHSCISLVLVVVKTSHFTATRWAQKITAV